MKATEILKQVWAAMETLETGWQTKQTFKAWETLEDLARKVEDNMKTENSTT
jgi:hypothetical protein